jgi:hypothetical protein
VDENNLPPEPNTPPKAGGIPDDDPFLNSLFKEADTKPMPPLPGDRGGKARDRYQKRREKNPAPDIKAEMRAEKLQTAAPDPAAQTPTSRFRPVQASPVQEQPQFAPRLRRSQVAVPRSFTMPKIDFKRYGVYAYAGAALLVVVGVVVFLQLFKNDPAPTFPNAIWIGSEWTFEQPLADDVALFADRLRQHRIGTVYAWVSYLKGDDEWSGIASGTHTFDEVEPHVIRFVNQFRDAYPQATLYGWVSFPVDIAGRHRLNDPAVVQKIAEFSGSVVRELGFDGVMLNAESVWEANADDYITLLQAVRREIGDAPLAVAVFPDWSPSGVDIPKPPLIAPGTEYSTAFKQRIALLVDEIMVMAYNSALSTSSDYVEWVAYQTAVYANAIADVDGGATVRIGIPTYDAETDAHDPDVENIATAVIGVTEGLQQAGDASGVIDGVALYASWEMDDAEWTDFNRFWLQRR